MNIACRAILNAVMQGKMLQVKKSDNLLKLMLYKTLKMLSQPVKSCNFML